MILRPTRSLEILRDFFSIAIIDGAGLDPAGNLPREFGWGIYSYCILNDDKARGYNLHLEVSFIPGGILVTDARSGLFITKFPFGTDAHTINLYFERGCPPGLYGQALRQRPRAIWGPEQRFVPQSRRRQLYSAAKR